MNSPLVSICIPTYNGAQHLAACLDSISCQLYPRFEILIVDDRSSDDTWNILNRYAEKDSRIRLFRNNQNLGLVRNWNRCLELAKGEWIKFVFQDDSVAENCLEQFVNHTKYNCPFIACSRSFIFEGNCPEELIKFYNDNKQHIDFIFSDKTQISGSDYSKLVVHKIGWNLIGEPTTVMLHKDIFRNYGPFNTNLIMSCDLEYWTRVAIHTGVVFIPEELVSFRVHQSSASSTNRSERQYRMNVLDSLIILHDIVHASVYQPLRDMASRQPPYVNFGQRFRERSCHARFIAETAYKASDPSLLFEWKNLLKIYPKLSINEVEYLIWKVKMHFKK